MLQPQFELDPAIAERLRPQSRDDVEGVYWFVRKMAFTILMDHKVALEKVSIKAEIREIERLSIERFRAEYQGVFQSAKGAGLSLREVSKYYWSHDKDRVIMAIIGLSIAREMELRGPNASFRWWKTDGVKHRES